MSVHRRPLMEGALTAAPLVPGILFGGMLYGATAVSSGMPPWTVIATSCLVATGTAQFVALDLLNRETAWWLVVLVGLLINLRFAAYAMDLGGRQLDFNDRSLAKNDCQSRPATWRRWAYFGLVTDEGYALTVARHERGDNRVAGFYAWSAALMVWIWTAWLAGTAMGALGGAKMPSFPGLELAVPLTLLSVLVLMITSSRHVRVAMVAGGTAFVLRTAPFGLGLLAGIVAGLALGMATAPSQRAVETSS